MFATHLSHFIKKEGVCEAATYLPELQVAADELVRPSAHVAPPFPQENAAWVGWVRHQHPDANSGTFYDGIWHPV